MEGKSAQNLSWERERENSREGKGRVCVLVVVSFFLSDLMVR